MSQKDTDKVAEKVPQSLEPWTNTLKGLFQSPVLWIAALGYFVDLFDLVLFGVYRVQSLRSLGLSDEEVFNTGALLLNCQMAGMLVGGFAWGILGDKRGRLSVLFGSIACYSVANLLNAFVSSVPQYAVLRFISGFGLAGEFGAAVTLITESLPKRTRGLGATFIAAIGFLGAMTAATLSHVIEWRDGYLLGGILGLLLLFTRFRLRESPLFQNLRKATGEVSWGKAKWLLTNASIRRRYFLSLLVGLPIWFIAGILMTFSPEIGRDLGLSGEVLAGTTILLSYGGTIVGDIFSGVISQILGSRRRTIGLFLLFDLFLILTLYFFLPGASLATFYLFAVLLGVANGYWALFAVVASEQFGTNLRSTVTTSITNLVRGFTVPMTFLFLYLKPFVGVTPATVWIGLAVIAAAFYGLWKIDETFTANLDYAEGKVSGK